MASVGRMKLGSQGLEVSAQGRGCMGMSAFYGPPKPEADMITLIHHAVQSGITFLDTSDIYGPVTNETLLGKSLKGIRKEVELATKFGISNGDGRRKWEIRGDLAYVRAACEASLKRLDVDCINLYYQHRIDTRIPIEITFLSGGLIPFTQIPIIAVLAVQLEWSLWSRDVEEDIVPTCRATQRNDIAEVCAAKFRKAPKIRIESRHARIHGSAIQVAAGPLLPLMLHGLHIVEKLVH